MATRPAAWHEHVGEREHQQCSLRAERLNRREASVVPATFVNYAPTIPMLGIFPTIQTLGAQAVLLMLALAYVLVPRGADARRVRVAEQAAMRRAQQG